MGEIDKLRRAKEKLQLAQQNNESVLIPSLNVHISFNQLTVEQLEEYKLSIGMQKYYHR